MFQPGQLEAIVREQQRDRRRAVARSYPAKIHKEQPIVTIYPAQKAISWLGLLMVEWGLKLQGRNPSLLPPTTIQECHHS
jgi:hypothetical protein